MQIFSGIGIVVVLVFALRGFFSSDFAPDNLNGEEALPVANSVIEHFNNPIRLHKENTAYHDGVAYRVECKRRVFGNRPGTNGPRYVLYIHGIHNRDDAKFILDESMDMKNKYVVEGLKNFKKFYRVEIRSSHIILEY